MLVGETYEIPGLLTFNQSAISLIITKVGSDLSGAGSTVARKVHFKIFSKDMFLEVQNEKCGSICIYIYIYIYKSIQIHVNQYKST